MGETRGAQLLGQVVGAVGLASVAGAMGVMDRVVARWVAAVELPSVEQQRGLEICYNLPAWAWFQSADVGAALAPATPPAVTVTFDANSDSLDLLNAQLERISADINTARNNTLGGVNYSDVTKLERLYVQVLEKRAILSGQLKAIEENRLARTETFRGFVRKITETLREFPAARVAVIRALGLDVEGHP